MREVCANLLCPDKITSAKKLLSVLRKFNIVGLLGFSFFAQLRFQNGQSGD